MDVRPRFGQVIFPHFLLGDFEMKPILSLMLFALVSSAGFANAAIESAVLNSASTALQVFAYDFETTYNKPLTNELIGLSAQAQTPEVSALIYAFNAPQSMSKYTYRCQPLASGSCTGVGASSPSAHTASQFFKYADFVIAIQEAETLFKQLGGKPQAITSVKAWQNRSGIEFILTQSSSTPTYMMCHYHGTSIDCHRKSKPGNGEPQ